VTESLRILLAQVIDYAGTFPPASLDLVTAIKNYETYRQGEWAWMLGRFVVPAAQVEEVKGLPVTVTAADVEALLRSAEAWGKTNDPRFAEARLQQLEIKVASLAEIEQVRKLTSLPTYFEIPASGELIPAVERAKVRTSNIGSEDLAQFVARCADARVPFKATAGLHQALSDGRPGFLNVLLAAAFAQAGEREKTLVELLEDNSFAFDAGGVTWRGRRLTNAQLERHLLVAIGSCSFDEPVESLRRL